MKPVNCVIQLSEVKQLAELGPYGLTEFIRDQFPSCTAIFLCSSDLIVLRKEKEFLSLPDKKGHL